MAQRPSARKKQKALAEAGTSSSTAQRGVLA
jgi:hypothetical protein